MKNALVEMKPKDAPLGGRIPGPEPTIVGRRIRIASLVTDCGGVQVGGFTDLSLNERNTSEMVATAAGIFARHIDPRRADRQVFVPWSSIASVELLPED